MWIYIDGQSISDSRNKRKQLEARRGAEEGYSEASAEGNHSAHWVSFHDFSNRHLAKNERKYDTYSTLHNFIDYNIIYLRVLLGK